MMCEHERRLHWVGLCSPLYIYIYTYIHNIMQLYRCSEASCSAGMYLKGACPDSNMLFRGHHRIVWQTKPVCFVDPPLTALIHELDGSHPSVAI